MKETLFSQDKFLHFIICLILAVVNPFFSIVLAIGKEYRDSKSKDNYWSWYDIIADAVGCVIGSIIWWIVIRPAMPF